jgi:hypothetical protein
MATLQRPPTLREFVIHSLLRWRERDTLVDRDDEEPTRQLKRPESDPPPREPRGSRTSIVFDLSAAAALPLRPSFPDPTPSLLPFTRAEIERLLGSPAAQLVRRHERGRPLARDRRGHALAVPLAILLALAVLAACAPLR